jgi:NosR/NirI family transcriptional regulator, nitrous oxide reductase regulator
LAAAHKNLHPRSKEHTDRLLGVIAILTIMIAWLAGFYRARANVMPFIHQAFPSANHFESTGTHIYAAYQGNQIIGYVSIGQANGYGGPFEAAVGVDLEGNVTGFAIVDHKETPSFLKRVQSSNLIKTLIGKSYQEAFQLDQDVDGVSGATYTSIAIAEAVRNGSRQVASGPLGLSLPLETSRTIQFGLPEITLIALFATGFISHRQKFPYTKQMRWISMVAGLLIIGFYLNRPLTSANITQLLLGFWPTWQTNLYWYILIGGILFVLVVDNKNSYCDWFCPFGAAQECMGLVGGAKVHSAGKYKDKLKWLQRGLAWLAIVLALLFRNPGISSYEVFGTLFDLTGSPSQFILLGIVLLVALFIKRPWCGYLCPLRPLEEFIRMMRRWIIGLWNTRLRKIA